jgi:molecular chaperone DnaK
MSNSGRQNLVGIDLGTTMSVIAHLDPSGALTTLPNSEGEPLTPSAVYLAGTDAVVGKAAKQAGEGLPEKVATYIKRDMGKPWYSRLVDGRQFRPETLSAILLRKLKLDAERKVGPIHQAVITVPAFFDDARRRATEDAGHIAGLDVVQIVNEPTAAALCYCLEGKVDKRSGAVAPDFPDGKITAVVYDLGGGTFDVTCIHLHEKQIDILATDGAVRLGGKDWDDRIIKHVVEQFQAKYGVEIPQDQRQALANQAESAKKMLSRLPQAELVCFHEGRSLRIAFTRSEFEEMTRDLLVRTEFYIGDVVKKQAKLPGSDQPLTWTDIDRILLVGGSTKMPMVREMLRRLTGKEPDVSLDPDQVVARGAAIYAAIQAFRERDDLLEVAEELPDLGDVGIVDVNSHSLGIPAFNREQNRPVSAILIRKNHQLPCAVSRMFRVRETGAAALAVRVQEGEAPDPDANIDLGKCVITDLPPNLPKGAPIQVRLSYGANGLVSVMALDMTGGRFAHATIERKSGLTEEDIEREKQFVAKLNIQ